MSEAMGRQIGKYEVKELLGSGGMGQVYKAYHPILERDVAIKVIRTEILDDPVATQRFYREARIVAALRHPGIVQVHDFDIEGDTLYMVMEFVPGVSLKRHLDAVYEQEQRLPLAEALRLFQLICQAVAYAHSLGVVHLDLKPANVLLTPKGNPILADFGLSKIIGSERLVETGSITGTPTYMSPEQCRGDAGDERSDIYSLGVMLYELTTSSLPFSDNTPVALILKHIAEPPPPPRTVNPDLPVSLEKIIQKTLQKEASERYQSIVELLEALDEVVVPIGGVPSVLLDVDAVPPEDGRCPYRGLQVFEEQHAEFYFGREALVQRLLEQLRLLTDSNQNSTSTGGAGDRFLAILGASGSGKSSLVRAGLIPALRAGAIPGSTDWTVCLMKPGERPLETLAGELVSLLPDSSAANGDLSRRLRLVMGNLATDGRTLHLALRLAWPDARPEKRLLLVVDQFEELFTSVSDETERYRFIENLLYAAAIRESPVVVLLTMRADFYHHCAAYRDLANRISSQQLLVGAMNTAELQRAIEQPAHQVGLKFEPGLVSAILEDVAQEPGALPLLQHALLELWERRQGRLLTLRAYQVSGGVQGAIAQRADAIYQGFQPEEQAIVRRIMLRLTKPGEEGAQPTRRRGKLSDFTARPEDESMVEAVVQGLADARLVTTDEETVEVAHEALIRGWPRLQEWLEADREGLRLHHHLAEAARAWAALDRDPGELYRGARLATTSEWAAEHADELNALEREFLKESQALSQRREAEREAQRRRELAQAQELAEAERRRAEVQARATRRLGVLAVILVLLLGLAIAAVQFAVNGQRVLDARRLAFAAQSQLDSAPETALLLAYEAVSRRHDFQSEQALRDALDAFTWRPTRLSGHADQLLDGRFSPDGQHLLTAAADGTVRLWDLQGRVLATLEGHEDEVLSATFDPEGQRVLTASSDGTARLWDLEGQTLVTFEGHEDGLTGALFSPDGQHILTASEDSTARLWDLEGQSLATFEGHEDEVVRAVFSPDGQRILTASEDGTAHLWDSEGNALVILQHTENVTNAVFSPDGQYIYTSAGRENSVRLWDLEGQPVSTFYGHTRNVSSIVFSPDGQQVLTASEDGTARLWDLTGQPINTFRGHTSSVVSAVFSPDGRSVLTASSDGTAQLWQEIGPFLPTLRGHEDEVESAVYSADGQRILTASTDGTARLWDLDGRSLVLFEGHEEQVESALYGPNGQTILTASEDGTARLWDLEGQLLATFNHDDEVSSAVFSPDGQQVLTASNDSTARLWDLNGQLLTTFTGHEDELQEALFSPDGQGVLTVSEDGTARLWNLSGQLLTVFEVDDGDLQSAIFSPDGQRILTVSGDGTAKLWDQEGQLLVTFAGHSDAIEKGVFSADGQRVLTASWDRTARLWDLDGRTLATFAGHTNVVKWAVFSHDGEYVLTASDDGTARLWNLDGEPVAILRGHDNWVASAVFSPDRGRIVTASRDYTARQYLVSVTDLLAVAACRVGRSLTDEEIARFEVGRPRFVFEERQCPP